MLLAGGVAQDVDAVSTQAEDPFTPSSTFPFLGSVLESGRAEQHPKATLRYAEDIFTMINPLLFRQSRFIHDQAAQDLSDIFPLAFNLV